MYGRGKKDIYNSINSKWSTDINKEIKKKEYSYSDFDDTKSDSSFYEKSEPYKIETKSVMTVQDLKGESEKNDTILEYVKGIDSESKAIFEVLSKLDKKYEPIDYDKIQQLIPQPVAQKLPDVQHVLPVLPVEVPVLPPPVIVEEKETYHEQLDTLIHTNNKLIQTVSKLSLELKHVKLELLEAIQKLDYVSSHVEHLYDKSFYNKQVEPKVPKEEVVKPEPIVETIEKIEEPILIHIEDAPLIEHTVENVVEQVVENVVEHAEEVNDPIVETVEEEPKIEEILPEEPVQPIFKIGNKSTKRKK